MKAKIYPSNVHSISALRAAMDAMGMTDFQKAMLLEVMSIPKGSTATYKQIAERIGNPNTYRAVGTVLRKNPFAPFVPCHRVVTPSHGFSRGLPGWL
ncbi:MAG: methylated-DNA--[protein]-cysteine S-methyltransferase [Candidatus Micrarchaeia archaeon]